jgi:hypothetical protein
MFPLKITLGLLKSWITLFSKSVHLGRENAKLFLVLVQKFWEGDVYLAGCQLGQEWCGLEKTLERLA